MTRSNLPVRWIHAGGAHLYQDFTRTGGRPLGLHDFQDLGTAEGPLTARSHCWHAPILKGDGLCCKVGTYVEGRYLMDTAKGDSFCSSHEGASWTVPPVECPSRTVLEALANKWVLYVLGALQEEGGPMRFNQVGRAVPGVTQKMLTQTLRALERDGLVVRRVYPTVPPRVEYELTPLGHEAGKLTVLIGEWALAHVDQIHTARTTFDHQAATAYTPLT